nr:MAG TPA: Protein translocase subunit SecDF PROTEIN, beta barrel, TRANSPORT [Caudoviricetes sp.]
MLPLSSIVTVFAILAVYVFILFRFIPSVRKTIKAWIYTLVFIGLFFPDMELWKFPFGVKVGIQLYAIAVCGIELIEMYLKCYLEKMKREGKRLSERMNTLYESL